LREDGRVLERNLDLEDGRTLHVYDTGPAGAGELAVFWHHGTPNVGPPPAPLLPTSARLTVRWVSHDRPGYGGSTALRGRDVASVAGDVASVADALGIDRFAVMGHSGGGPHALACAALLTERVVGAVSVSGLAPYDAEGLDWYAGMTDSGVDSLRAAAAGREAKERYEAAGVEYDQEFTPADRAALSGPWSWLDTVTGPDAGAGLEGLVDDDLAFVCPWGFDPAAVIAPTLLLHGSRDRIVPAAHSAWLAHRCASAELRLGRDDGHISILESAESALEWLRAHA
jgi:pimeloyl-ACP methyl ester carboxylesterase